MFKCVFFGTQTLNIHSSPVNIYYFKREDGGSESAPCRPAGSPELLENPTLSSLPRVNASNVQPTLGCGNQHTMGTVNTVCLGVKGGFRGDGWNFNGGYINENVQFMRGRWECYTYTATVHTLLSPGSVCVCERERERESRRKREQLLNHRHTSPFPVFLLTWLAQFHLCKCSVLCEGIRALRLERSYGTRKTK